MEPTNIENQTISPSLPAEPQDFPPSPLKRRREIDEDEYKNAYMGASNPPDVKRPSPEKGHTYPIPTPLSTNERLLSSRPKFPSMLRYSIVMEDGLLETPQLPSAHESGLALTNYWDRPSQSDTVNLRSLATQSLALQAGQSLRRSVDHFQAQPYPSDSYDKGVQDLNDSVLPSGYISTSSSLASALGTPPTNSHQFQSHEGVKQSVDSSLPPADHNSWESSQNVPKQPQLNYWIRRHRLPPGKEAWLAETHDVLSTVLRCRFFASYAMQMAHYASGWTSIGYIQLVETLKRGPPFPPEDQDNDLDDKVINADNVKDWFHLGEMPAEIIFRVLKWTSYPLWGIFFDDERGTVHLEPKRGVKQLKTIIYHYYKSLNTMGWQRATWLYPNPLHNEALPVVAYTTLLKVGAHAQRSH